MDRQAQQVEGGCRKRAAGPLLQPVVGDQPDGQGRQDGEHPHGDPGSPHQKAESRRHQGGHHPGQGAVKEGGDGDHHGTAVEDQPRSQNQGIEHSDHRRPPEEQPLEPGAGAAAPGPALFDKAGDHA